MEHPEAEVVISAGRGKRPQGLHGLSVVKYVTVAPRKRGACSLQVHKDFPNSGSHCRGGGRGPDTTHALRFLWRGRHPMPGQQDKTPSNRSTGRTLGV